MASVQLQKLAFFYQSMQSNSSPWPTSNFRIAIFKDITKWWERYLFKAVCNQFIHFDRPLIFWKWRLFLSHAILAGRSTSEAAARAVNPPLILWSASASSYISGAPLYKQNKTKYFSVLYFSVMQGALCLYVRFWLPLAN